MAGASRRTLRLTPEKPRVIRLDVGRAIWNTPILRLTTLRTAKGGVRARVKEARGIADALVGVLPVGTLEHLCCALETRVPYYFKARIAELKAEREMRQRAEARTQ